MFLSGSEIQCMQDKCWYWDEWSCGMNDVCSLDAVTVLVELMSRICKCLHLQMSASANVWSCKRGVWSCKM